MSQTQTPSTTPLTTAQVMSITGASFRCIDYWTRCGYLDVTHPAAGPGSHRGWSRADVAQAVAFSAMAEVLPDLTMASAVARLARARFEADDYAGSIVVYPGGEAVFVDTYGLLHALSAPIAVVVHLPALLAPVSDAFAAAA